MEDLKKQLSLCERQQAMDFISMGVGCNCLVAIYEVGLLDALLKKEPICLEHLPKWGNSSCLRSALISLEHCNVLEQSDGVFFLTALGKSLSEFIGLITIFFSGYSQLVLKQGLIARNSISARREFLNGPVISQASVQISSWIFPTLLKEIEKLSLFGAICDLGCGYASMLSQLCEKLGVKGIGFESEESVVQEVRQSLTNSSVTIEVADVKSLSGIWKDVQLIMQCHLFHDFTPLESCIQCIDSYLHSFPHLEYFCYIDTVAPSLKKPNFFPGFDYVHGLLGISTRTYEETKNLFESSKYVVRKEVEIIELPNTFLWILEPQ